MLYYKSPLSWPESIPVTALAMQRSDNGFSADMPLADAINFLKEEIESSGIAQAVLYTDIDQPHVERLRKKVGSRTGASLHIKHRGHAYIITCDRWQRLEHNIYAIHLTLRQWSNMERWGIASLPVLMAGFELERSHDDNDIADTSLNPSGEIVKCLEEFGLSSNATLDDASAIYHRRAKSLNNDNEQLVKLNLQMDKIRAYFSGKEME